MSNADAHAHAPTVVVVGSVHTDLVATAARLPRRGETMPGHAFASHPGGKGGNQAIQVALMGVRSRLLGRVGNDPCGERLRSALAAKGVDTSLLGIDPDAPTGTSTVLAELGGDYASIIVPGASLRLTPDLVEIARPAIAAADLLLCQLEIAPETIAAAIEVAQREGTRVMLNASPAPDRDDLFPRSFWEAIDVLIVNQAEGMALVDPFPSVLGALSSADPTALVSDLQLRLGSQAVVVTMGANGVVAKDAVGTIHLAGHSMHVVDTIGAGDAFAGTLAAEIARGATIREALPVANAAGALAVTKAGAYDALPTAAEVWRLASADE